MNIIFYVAVGILSSIIANGMGYDISDPQYWAISISFIIVVNSLYIAVKK